MSGTFYFLKVTKQSEQLKAERAIVPIEGLLLTDSMQLVSMNGTSWLNGMTVVGWGPWREAVAYIETGELMTQDWSNGPESPTPKTPDA